MVVVALPDIIGCLITRLRSFSELTALVGSGTPRISGSRQDAWAMPTSAIIVRKAGGPPDDLYTMGRQRTRIDLLCYGSDGRNADRVWAMAHRVLVPKQDTRASFKLTIGGQVVRVDQLIPESDAVSGTEPQTGYPRTFASYHVLWWG